MRGQSACERRDENVTLPAKSVRQPLSAGAFLPKRGVIAKELLTTNGKCPSAHNPHTITTALPKTSRRISGTSVLCMVRLRLERSIEPKRTIWSRQTLARASLALSPTSVIDGVIRCPGNSNGAFLYDGKETPLARGGIKNFDSTATFQP
ncbi:predicted protein [Histoplasma capsulatum G186AR]|uniref:Uncharacterized protein n=1 Tax=Ajellomyces capsulatus (strain G186AR / H82 / ATCC MYA-2454 / RMSCC 2432) TaxID=447093 RepID=C0NB55_AJECG|nr:uncharacterized protein HCBG_00351 [Histoplasma capsulatum G186AR]EEH10896.1 predicted protein [Histoplasma capsulatum G186AR]